MMNSEDVTTASGNDNKSKSQLSALGSDDFDFKPRLQMIDCEEERNESVVNVGEKSPSKSPLQKTEIENNSMLNNSMLSQVGKVIYPLGEPPKTKSIASPEVKENMLRKYYSLKPGVFEHAVEDVKCYLKPTVDGKFLSAWLLAEIDHWDHEKEKLLILTDTLIILIKYNFVATRIEDCRRVQLHSIDRIQGGCFQYPDKTMMMPRAFQTGIRFSWNKNEVLTKWQRFSPFFNNPSYITITQHKSVYHMNEVPPFMVYEDFKLAIIKAAESAGANFEVVMEPIFIEVYIGAMSVIHNSSDLGYSKDRGAASF